MVVAVEAEDLADGGGDVVGDAVQAVVVVVDVTPAHDFVDEEALPRVPVGAVLDLVEEHDRVRVGLAGLLQGEQLEGLVEGAEATGEHGEAGRLLHEHQLAREEVLHGEELVVGDEGVRLLLEREADVDADGPLQPCALHACGHDPGAGAGDHHPALRGEGVGQVARLLVERVVAKRARRAEDRHLRDVAVAGEEGERGPHLLEGGVGDLQVESIDVVRRETHGRHEDLEELVAVGRGADFVEEGEQPAVEIGARRAGAGCRLGHLLAESDDGAAHGRRHPRKRGPGDGAGSQQDGLAGAVPAEAVLHPEWPG